MKNHKQKLRKVTTAVATTSILLNPTLSGTIAVAESLEAKEQTSTSQVVQKGEQLPNEIPDLSVDQSEQVPASSDKEEVAIETSKSKDSDVNDVNIEEPKEEILNWSLNNTSKPIIAGDNFSIKLSGSINDAKIILPDGISYDSQKNQAQLQDDITFNNNTRELSIKNITHYTDLELILSADKSGSYDLQMLKNNNEKIGDPYTLVVEEKASEDTDKSTLSQEKPEEEKASITTEEGVKNPKVSSEYVSINTTSNPQTEITSSAERIIYATTLSHTNSTKPIDSGKLVFTIENGKFNTYPKVADYKDILKASTLSDDGKTITLTLNDGIPSGNFTTFSYSAYAAVGIEEGTDITVKSTFTGQFRGESTTFINENNKVVKANITGGAVKPVVPGTTSWELTAERNTTLYPGATTDAFPRLKSLNTEQGFTNLRVKFHYSDALKVSWSERLINTYGIYFKNGESQTVKVQPELIEKVDEQTYIMSIGEVNPEQIDNIAFISTQKVPEDAILGESFKITMTVMEADEPILSQEMDYTVGSPQTTVKFDAKSSGEKELTPGQSFTTSYKTTGITTKIVEDYQVTIDVPDEVIPNRVLNGLLSGGTSNISSVETYVNGVWVNVPKNSDGDFDIQQSEISQLRINYSPVNGIIQNYQPFRVEWKVKDKVADDTKITLKNHISYTDYAGDLQTPDVSNTDLSYLIKNDAQRISTKAAVYQQNKSKEFDDATVLAGDTFEMNYRIGNEQGELEQPYVFIKLPKGIEVKNTDNTIQYPYGNVISYNSSPLYGKEVTPISKANNVGSFEATDGSMVYYYKADDTSLTQSDYMQMLLIGNRYTVKNVEAGIYDIEVGMGSLKENYEDVTLNSGYTKSSLSSELKSKLGSNATTYYSKKTKMIVGKVDKVTTGVSVKGSEDTQWLDASKVGKVVPGKKVSYRVSIKNEGTENYSNVQLVNVLPYVGDTLVSTSLSRNSQFQINPDSSGVSVTYNGQVTNDITLDYSLSNNPLRFSSPSGAALGADAWVSTVSDYSKVRAIRIGAPSMILKPGDEIILEYSGVVVLDAERPQNDTETFTANNSVAYRFETMDGQVRAGEPSVSTVGTTKAEADGIISGGTYIDLEKNGSKESTDPGLNQVSYELFKKNSTGQFVSTGLTSESSSDSKGNNGIFGFTDLDYGTYKVKVTLPDTKGAEFITTGVDQVEEINDTTAWVKQNGSTEFILNDSSSTSHEIKNLSVPIFVNTPLTGSINFKNKDGLVLNSSYGKGITVDLYDGSSKIASTISGDNGVYTFEELSINTKGDYSLKFTLPSGTEYVYTDDNKSGELLVNLEPGIGTSDLTDVYITDTDLPTAKIELESGHGSNKDINPSAINLKASDTTTAFTTNWEIISDGNVVYAGTSSNEETSLKEQLNYLIGDKKAGDYTVNMTVKDFAGNQATTSENFSLKFGTVNFTVDGKEHAKVENVLWYIDKVNEPQVPIKAGYTFDKWVTVDNTPWDFSSGTISEENIELKALFKAEDQTLTFDVNGGDSASKPEDIKADTDENVDLSTIATPTRTGYTFKYWYVKGDVDKNDVGTTFKMPAGGTTLVAEWEVNTYTIKFDGNGGSASNPLKDIKVEYGANITLPKNEYTRDGYIFKGWSLDKDANIATYQNEATIKNLTSKNGGEVTLYAIWSQDETTINVKDSTLYVGDSWSAENNFVNAQNQDGDELALEDLTVTGTVDVTKIGDYKVTYSYNGVTSSATIHVLANQSAVEAKDSTLYVGDTWKSEDNFTKATDKTGANVDFKDVTVIGSVDTTKVGSYLVTYSYGGKNIKINVTVLANQELINAKDSTLYVGDTWNSEDNFIKATDKTGANVDFKDVIVEGSVDTSKVGDYQVKYVYSGKSIDITVHVLVNETAVETKDSTLYVGDTWNSEDNFIKATDKTGANVDFKDITVTGTVDTSKVGDYKVTYSYGGKSANVIVHVVTNQEIIEAKDSTLYVGDTWKAVDNFIKATDKTGANVDFKEVTVIGSVDTTKVGNYKVTYSYGSKTMDVIVHVLINQTAVEAKDSTLYVGDTWKAEDNFTKAIDKTGANVDFKDVTVTGTVDTTKVGNYKVTYSYGNKTMDVIVHVLTNQTAVEAKDSTLYVGDTWKAEDNFTKAIDKTGAKVDFKDVTVTGTVDMSKVGDYEVTYSYEGVDTKVTIHVLTNQTAVEAKDSTLYVGDTWKAADNFIKATDKTGANVDFKDVTVTGTADTTKVGVYKITYSYGGKTLDVTVKVLTNQTAVEAKDSTLYVGDTWKAEDNFTKAIDKTGAKVDFKDVTVAGTVDMSKVGDYEVTYSYDGVDTKVTIHVLTNQTAVEAKDSTLYVGDTWKAADNFIKATDKTGANVDFKDVTVAVTVDMSKVGDYEVTYSYDGVDTKVTIHVLTNQKAVEAKDSTLYVGDTWKAEDNFTKAIDKTGAKVDFKDVTVAGTVDTTKVGNYEVTYSYDGVDTKVTIHVLTNQTAVEAKDSTLYVGDTWKAEDNFTKAIDKTGAKVDFKDVTVAGTVDTTKVGDYEVTYSYDGVDTKVTIHVLTNQTAVEAKDSTLYVGDTWKAEDNFTKAIDKTGAKVDFKDVTVAGTVDTTKVGDYEVTYSYDGVDTKVTIHVLTNQKAVEAKDPTNQEADKTEAIEKSASVNEKDSSSLLPSTGANSTPLLSVIGISILSALLFVLRTFKKKEEK